MSVPNDGSRRSGPPVTLHGRQPPRAGAPRGDRRGEEATGTTGHETPPCESCPVLPRCLLAELRRRPAQFAERHRARFYSRGQFVFDEGEQPLGLYSVCSGVVKVFQLTAAGAQTVMSVAAPGDLFGHTALLSAGPHAETAQAVAASLVCFLPRDFVLSGFDTEPRLAVRVIRLLAREVLAMEARLLSLIHKPVSARIAEVLFERAAMEGQAQAKEFVLRLGLKRDELASLVGTTAETLVRELKKMEKRGLIRLEKRDIRVLDLAALAEMGSSACGRSTPGGPGERR